MSKIRKAQAYYLDIKNKKKYFPSNVLNWQLLGKFLGQVPNVIGENQARFFCEKRHQKTKEFLKLHFDEFVENYNFTQDNLENKKIIWTLWWQGYDNAPEIVKYCLDNMKKLAHENGFEFYCLDESTFERYVKIPEYLKLKIKKGYISIANISDMIRVCLLSQYGGTWIDSTVFIHSSFKWDNFSKSYFTIKTGEMTDYSPNVSKNRWKTFLLSGNSSLYEFTRDFFFEYFKKFDYVIDYLLIDYIFDIAFDTNAEIKKQMLELESTNLNLFWLESHFSEKFDRNIWKHISENTKIFKTTYKLDTKIKCDSENYYSALIKSKLK